MDFELDKDILVVEPENKQGYYYYCWYYYLLLHLVSSFRISINRVESKNQLFGGGRTRSSAADRRDGIKPIVFFYQEKRKIYIYSTNYDKPQPHKTPNPKNKKEEEAFH